MSRVCAFFVRDKRWIRHDSEMCLYRHVMPVSKCVDDAGKKLKLTTTTATTGALQGDAALFQFPRRMSLCHGQSPWLWLWHWFWQRLGSCYSRSHVTSGNLQNLELEKISLTRLHVATSIALMITCGGAESGARAGEEEERRKTSCQRRIYNNLNERG